MGAAKVILACRNTVAAEAAKRDIEATTDTTNVVEVWHIDLSSFDSVKAFATRAAELERLDILVNNASVLPMRYEEKEGYESMLTINTISTLLLTLLVLPTLRKSGVRHNATPKIVTVSSDGAFMTSFSQKTAPVIFDELRKDSDMNARYNTTKLLQLVFMHRLALATNESGKGHVIMSSLNPGLVRSDIFRNVPFPFSLMVNGLNWIFGRTAEVASCTIIDSALQGEDSHDTFRSSCEQRRYPEILVGDDGENLMNRVWSELLAIVEKIAPGATGEI